MNENLSPVWSHLTPFTVVRGEGVYLFDSEGNRFTDFTSGIGVTSTGHCHPKIVEAVQRQAGELIFSQVNIAVSRTTVELASKLDSITPSSIDSFFFSNSGAEAVEAAVKLARHATGRSNVIVFQGSFHGRTHQAMAMTTAKTVYRHRYLLPAGVHVAPFPAGQGHRGDEVDKVAYCLEQLELILLGRSAADETAALIIEPILGEGGYLPAPAEFLRGLRRICDENGILLIFDEVQTGFGRTGTMFAGERAGVAPDILVMAKGLASGLPLSAIGASRALMARWEKGTHGGTYGGGSVVPLAAAVATIETILDEGLVENSARQGERLQAGLRGLMTRTPGITDVRGSGLMVGAEFSDGQGRPDKAAARSVQRGCLEQGLLLLTCGTFENTIRWIPPLIVTTEQIDAAVEIFSRSVKNHYQTVGT